MTSDALNPISMFDVHYDEIASIGNAEDWKMPPDLENHLEIREESYAAEPAFDDSSRNLYKAETDDFSAVDEKHERNGFLENLNQLEIRARLLFRTTPHSL